MRRIPTLLSTLSLYAVCVSAGWASAVVASPFDTSYTITDLGPVSGLPQPYGGLNFYIHESMSIQFRAEFFNVMEHAQFSNPTGSFTSSQFGQVTSVQTGSRGSGGRIGQVSLKFLW